MEIVQEIGAYAGLAAIVGLALLSALYFSQARDVRRLRQWAGKAPERTSEPAAQAPRVTTRPVPRARGTATSTVRPLPAGNLAGAPAKATAAGAGAAVATGPAAATPAARVAEAPREEEETGGGGEGNGVSQDTMAHPPPLTPEKDEEPAEEDESLSEEHDAVGDEDFERATARGGAEDEEDEDLYEDGEDDEYDEYDEETGDRPAVAAPVTQARRPVPPPPITVAGVKSPAPATSGGTILPPYERSRPGGAPAYRRVFSSPGRAVLVIGAAVLVLAAATLGGLQLAGNTDGGGQDSAGPSQPDGTAGANGQGGQAVNGGQPKRPAVEPASVTVAVLNGTTVQGAAQGIGDTVEGEGYQLGTVSNFTDQTRAESVVLYARGAEREASDVMRRLKIGQREPIDANTQSTAGDASVVVLVGADKAQQ